MSEKKGRQLTDHVFNMKWNQLYSTEEFEQEYGYDGNDLGVNYSKDCSVFKLWSPFAKKVILNLYQNGDAAEDDRIESLTMEQKKNGVWEIAVNRDLVNIFYTYSVSFDEDLEGRYDSEICDPYAKACGVNGRRAMVVDLSVTNPENWEQDKNPNEGLPLCESVIYELHVRDLSADDSSNIKNKGKFLGLTERGTTVNGDGKIPSGISHIKELGVTHIHLLPIYDYAALDEAGDYSEKEYNWGYDPLNYNIPEGSYSTNPYDGNVRIRELKQMVQSLHQDGISVIMDVVYNHTYNEDYCYNRAVPGYFHRIDSRGIRSNGSACGNDTASERKMVSKFIVDSVLYWAKEYHIDGFRFDLVGLIDINTINKIRDGLDKIRPNIMMYGEGWILDTALTKKNIKLATQKNVDLLKNFAMFNDDIRDAMKGSVFEEDEMGFISGNTKMASMLKKSIMGMPDWSDSPCKVINYTSCHDNYTLFDKLRMCNEGERFEVYVRQNLLAASIVLLSQGIPLLHAGEEILREKIDRDGNYVSDSVRDSDFVNSIKWYHLEEKTYFDVNEYYKGLIAFRKAHPLLMLSSKADVLQHMRFLETEVEGVIAYQLKDENEEMIVVFNGSAEDVAISLGADQDYQIYIADGKAGVTVLGTCQDELRVAAFCCSVIVRQFVK